MKGFTLLELILVVLLIGILAAVAVPRFSTSAAGLDAAARKIQSDIVYAQSLAMSRGVAHGIDFVAGSPYVLYRGTPSTPVVDPVTHLTFSENLNRYGPTHVSNNFRVEFNSVGRPTTGGGGSVTISNNGSTKTILVTANTGRVVIP